MTLTELFNTGKYNTDKGNVHNYLEVYESLFYSRKNDFLTLLEVGVLKGGSLRLWTDYFVNANILGIDIYNHENIFDNPRTIELIKDIKTLDVNELPYSSFDIAIDDASHTVEDQLIFIEKIYPLLNNGGILIIEDIQDLSRLIWEYRKKINIPFEIIDRRYSRTNYNYDDILFIIKK